MPLKTSRPVKSSSKKESTTNNKKHKDNDSNINNINTNNENINLSPADQLRNIGIITTFALNSKKIHRNVRDIAVSNLTVTFHGMPLIEEAELSLNYGNRYGYIGRNGCGKSTFMKVIASRAFPIPDGIDIFHLKEEIEATEMTAKEAVMSVDKERATLENEAELLSDILASEADGSSNNNNHEGSTDEIMERLTQVYERLEELDASTAETRASKILSGLGFTTETQNKKTKDFSGGWRMRIALARALFIQPTLLLLDEPTNHLDMEAVVWLEDYLSQWKKILFMVSHSQDFMNTVCTHIVHHWKKRLVYYSGNYDSFVQTRSEKEEEQEKRYKAEQDQIKHMKTYVAKFGQGNAKMAKQAQSKEKVLDKMLKSGLTGTDITFGYPGCEILYSHVDFGIDLDSRVALVGPNGAGKSTLLKLMTGEIIPITGAIRPHAHLRISKFTQHFIDVLDLNLSPLDYFLLLFADMTRDEGRKFLGRFGISGNVQTQIMEQLSDGQKSRVVLAKMAKETPHLLFLDEPTNHLDMESIDSLAKAINGFTGGMILVSHDMRLISQVAKEIWLCDKKTVTKYMGEISDFKMQLRRQMQQENLIDADNMKGYNNNSSSSSIMSAPLVSKKKSNEIELTIAPPLVVVQGRNSSNNNIIGETVEQATLRKRLELADQAIAKQRARQAENNINSSNSNGNNNVSTTSSSSISTTSPTETEEEMEIRIKAEEKLAARMKRKAEKEAQDALTKKQEEERIQRREEQLKEAEEARKLKELKDKEHQEFLILKAAKDAKKKAEEEAEAALIAEAIANRRAEREARKREKIAQKIAAQENARLLAEKMVLDDVWTQEQQIRFEDALLIHTSTMDKYERWTAISKAVGDKTKNQCIMRYRYLKEYLIRTKEIEHISSIVISNM